MTWESFLFYLNYGDQLDNYFKLKGLVRNLPIVRLICNLILLREFGIWLAAFEETIGT